MNFKQGLPARSEVPVQETWNLADICATPEVFQAKLQSIQQQATELEKQYKGKIAALTDTSAVLELLARTEALYVLLSEVYNYTSLGVSTDMGNAALQKQNQSCGSVLAATQAKLSFIDSELLTLSDKRLDSLAFAQPDYRQMIADLKRRKAHSLQPETEMVLNALSQTLELPGDAYDITKLADMSFQDFEANSQTYANSFVLYENHYQSDPDTAVRRAAFTSFSQGLEKYINTVANDYNAQVQKEKTLATLRGYNSVIDYLLDSQNVTREMYDRQIDTIMRELAPHMRRYAKALGKDYGLAEVHYADLKASLDPAFAPAVSIEGSKPYIEGALSVLGPDYRDIVMRAFPERWIDFANNQGKSTGGFCASLYSGHAYILLSWNGQMSELFTLAHELGHAAHFILAAREHRYFGWEPSLYFVESPSTCNELLLGHYLRRQSDDPRFSRWVSATQIANTYYHNFVTHFMEAAFQREVYRLVDQGQQLQAEDFNRIFRQQLEQFWGDSVVLDPGAELTWMRQPHYYNGLYSYTYSAGLTISTAVAQRIDKEGQPAVTDWLNALKAGGTVNPVEFAALAGVDITTDQPLKDTIAYIGRLVDQL
ncbi:MAG: oligoendopeptidase F [Oscillospiraceae bacterium]|nr:oligoendopeptidase F [Oscillospiraceae bacterium]